MSVYAVVRVAPEGPTGRAAKVFPDASILDWFRAHWRGIASEKAADRYTRELLGTSSDLSILWAIIAEEEVPPPETAAQLGEYLTSFLETDGVILAEPHCVQMLEMYIDAHREVFLFDDHYLAEHPDRAALLLRPEWAVPADHAEDDGAFVPDEKVHELKPVGPAAGTTFLAFLDRASDSDDLLLHGGYQVRGLRLPDLPRHLLRAVPDAKWPLGLLLIRATLLADAKGMSAAEKTLLRRLREDPADDAAWEAYSSGLAGQAERSPLGRALRAASRYNAAYLRGDLDLPALAPGLRRSPAEALAALPTALPRRYSRADAEVHVADHLARMHRLDRYPRQITHLKEWFLFDDRWARRNPGLANGVLRAAVRWDVLS